MEKTEEYILTEAEKLFMQLGIKSVTMDDIAKQLSISKKTIYTFYKDKNNLVYKLIAKKLAEDECQMAERTKIASNAIEEVFLCMDFLKTMLAGINPTLFYDLQKYHSNAHQLMINFHHTYVFNTIKKGLERGIAEGIFRPDLNTEILATLRVSQINWSVGCDLVRNGSHSLYDVFLEATIHFLFGVSTLSGHVLINKYKNP
ncbi:MAG: TetR/AcrR family transcriptional regulator [Sphingobacteriales bacterium]|nr:MAG: TetR/AcrR family transcriptional regulator [Sphingobacteriales bacterium]TAF83846.1 MAG: TetR/AcrR family transcriptional regulator [Sphingobacteriales bacterium]